MNSLAADIVSAANALAAAARSQAREVVELRARLDQARATLQLVGADSPARDAPGRDRLARDEAGRRRVADDHGLRFPEVATIAEAAGIESLFVVSHRHIPVSRPDVVAEPVRELDAHILEQFTCLGAAAAVTGTLKLGTCICIVPQRDTISLARQVATIDHLSGGRFLFGVGAGWLVEEMRNHGVDPGDAGTGCASRSPRLRAIWVDDEAEFHGEFVDFDPIWLWPKPVQSASARARRREGERSLRAVVEYGDGWMPVVGDPATSRHSWRHSAGCATTLDGSRPRSRRACSSSTSRCCGSAPSWESTVWR